MRFTSLLKQLVLEQEQQSRFEILKNSLTKSTTDNQGNKQKPKMSSDEFIKIVQADPTTRLNGVDPETSDSEELGRIKAGKYVTWLIKHYLNPSTERSKGDAGYDAEVKQLKDRFIEDLFKVTDDLKKFERFKNSLDKENRDINKLTPSKLYDLVKDFNLTLATTTKSERKTAKVHPGAELLYDGNNWRVIKIEDPGPVGKEAACFSGGNMQETRWCTSAPGLQWFEKHIKDGPLYVVYNPNDTNVQQMTGLPVTRYQFHFPSNQFMDKDDRPIDLIGFLNGEGKEMKDIFKPEFAKGLTVGKGKEFVVDNFEHGSIGKYIALYGIEELFDNLPLDIEKFSIVNNTKKEIDIKLPENIDKFKNLKMVLLTNCVSKIPSTICNLKNLKFLMIVDCPNVKEIPECIVDMKSLNFLNLKGSNNIRIPEKLKLKNSEVENGMFDLSDDD